MYINADEKIHSRIGDGEDAPMKVRTISELFDLCEKGEVVYAHLGAVWKKIHIAVADDAIKTTGVAIVRSHYKVEHICPNDMRFMTVIKADKANAKIESVCANKLNKRSVLLENGENYFSGKEGMSMSYISEKKKNPALELKLFDLYVEPAWNPHFGDDEFNNAIELADGLIIDGDNYFDTVNEKESA